MTIVERYIERYKQIGKLAEIAEQRARLLRMKQKQLLVSFYSRRPKLLRTIRGERSQKVICNMAEVNQAYVSYVETGRFELIGEEMLFRILFAYSILEKENGLQRSA